MDLLRAQTFQYLQHMCGIYTWVFLSRIICVLQKATGLWIDENKVTLTCEFYPLYPADLSKDW